MPISHPVFVILPLLDKGHVCEYFDEGIVPALAKFGLEARRVDEQAVRGGIIDAIRGEIARSYFVIADLSLERPNCYYELGYTQAIGKPTLLISKAGTPIHFNISNQMVHSFQDAETIKSMLAKVVPKFLETERRATGDNLNGKFGRQCIRDSYRLAARVDRCTSKTCYLSFEMTSLDPKRPLTSAVRFCLHESYQPRSRQVIKPKPNGIALYEEVSSDGGPWTLGAQIVESGVELELDLATIPGASAWWYEKAYKKK